MRQSHTGHITLYDKTGKEMFTRVYQGLEHRAIMLDYWRRLYGRQFRFMSYGISPTIDNRQLTKIELKSAA